MDNLTQPENWVVTNSLNTFDLISFLPGVDISGLFTDPEYSDSKERFVTMEASENVTVMVKKDKSGFGIVRIEGLDLPVNG